MPNLTTPFLKLSGDTEQDLKQIEQWSVSLVDELKSLLCNLDGGNVIEASSVKAQNIDCTKARIKDAQVQSMTADKLTAGTIDAREIDVININADNINTGELNSELVHVGSSDADGSLEMTGDSIEFKENVAENGMRVEKVRIAMGRTENGNYVFTIQSRDGKTGIYMDESGEVYLTGAIETTKDCLIQGELRVGLYGTGQKGIRIYGDAYFPDPETGAYAKEYGSILPYVDSDGSEGINIVGNEGNVWINGRKIG